MSIRRHTTWGSADTCNSITCGYALCIGNNSLNDCIRVGLRNKKRKLHKAQAPTTVDSLEVDAYAVDIKRVENPFVKDDGDSDDEDSDDDVSGHLPKLKFHSTKSVSHAKMVHNSKEKKR